MARIWIISIVLVVTSPILMKAITIFCSNAGLGGMLAMNMLLEAITMNATKPICWSECQEAIEVQSSNPIRGISCLLDSTP